jgi:hypothetical protein
MADYRHHVAHPAVIFVPIPVAGSPQPLKWAKPPAYPQQDRRPWQPQRFIPAKQRKAQQLVDLMRELDRRAEDARQMLKPNAAGLKAWLGRAA